MKMKKWIIALMALAAVNCFANRILWAALDEGATVGTDTIFREYLDPSGLEINAARLSVGAPGVGMDNYTMELVQQLSLWIPEWEGDPGYWETEFPVTCLKDEDGEYPMGRYSSQFDLGSDPDTSVMVFFELGHVADWDDFDSPFVTLAYAGATISELDAEKHIYPSGTINPPIEADWMPTQFRAVGVPEPSTAILALLGVGLLFHRRRTTHA